MSSLRLAVLIATFLSFPSFAARADEPSLSIYTYDSFVAKGGLGHELIERFQARCHCKLNLIGTGDGGQLLTRLQLDRERGARVADLVIGIDGQTWDRIQPFVESWGKWRPRGYARLAPAARMPGGFLPYDYGFYSFVLDEQGFLKLKTKEIGIRDLLKPEWKRNIILEDPRTSTPGLAFLLYANEVGGSDFWEKFKGQWLTLAPGWDQAYGLFLKGEAPLVWSYTTSQAYHEEHGDTAHRYRAVLFAEGQPVQVEGAALVKGMRDFPEKLKLAHELLEFLISPEMQDLIPLKNWMYPALMSAKLPQSFEHLPKPKKIVHLTTRASEIEAALSNWRKQLQ